MKLKFCFFNIFIIYSFCGYSQNDYLFTQHFNNQLLINPAYAGSIEGTQLSGIARFQYVGLANQISATQSASFSTYLDKAKGGFGLNVTNDLIGLQRTTSASLSYAYQKQTNKVRIGVGLGVGFINLGLNGAAIITPTGEYTNGINHRDPILNTSRGNSFSPDFSAGVYLKGERFFASVSANHLFTLQKLKGVSADFFYNHDRNLVVSGGYNFKIGRRSAIQPMALLRTNFQRVQLDISTIFTIYDNILTGIAFRGYSPKTVDAFSLFLGGTFKNVKILYSYDANVSFLTKFNTGSHEISLSYILPRKQNVLDGKFYHNSRFL
jgi:type IX secretion system PorP/SprF family membrane protein